MTQMLARQTHTKHRNRASIRSAGVRVRTHHVSRYVLGGVRLPSGDVHAQRSRPICQSQGRARPRERGLLPQRRRGTLGTIGGGVDD